MKFPLPNSNLADVQKDLRRYVLGTAAAGREWDIDAQMPTYSCRRDSIGSILAAR